MRRAQLALIEDERETIDLYRILFSSDNVMSQFGLMGFEVHVATNVADAKELLWRHWRDHDPFDVIVLDLGLPINKTSKLNERWESGVEIAEAIRAQERATPNQRITRSVVVNSVNFRAEALQRLLATRIVHQFVDKASDDIDSTFLCRSVANAFLERLQGDWEKCKRAIMVRMLCEMSQMMCSRLSRTVTIGVSDALQEVRLLEQCIEDIMGLDVTQAFVTNSLISQATRTHESINNIRDQCLRERDLLRSIPVTREKRTNKVTIAEVVSSAKEYLSIGVIEKNIDLRDDSDEEHSQLELAVSVQYSTLLVEELLFAAIDGYAYCESEPRPIRILTEIKDSIAKISIVGPGSQFSETEMESIHRADFDRINIETRAWGLALASNIARNVGCELVVSNFDKERQLYSLSIPVVIA